MAQNFIQLPTDGTGKKAQSWDNIINGNDVHTGACVLTDSSGIEKATQTNPIRVDPVGTTPQPITGTIAVGNFPSEQSVNLNQVNGTALSGSNPVPVTVVSGGGSNASVGSTGTTAPTSATEFGIIVGGNLVGVSSSNPIPVSEATLDGCISANKVAVVDSAGNASLSTLAGTVSAGAVTVAGTVAATVTGSVTANAGTNLNTSLLALETGGNLAAIKADTDKIPSLGQALATASVPVVLTALQLTALTPLSTVAVTQSTSPWVVSNSGTFAVQEATLDGCISAGKVAVTDSAAEASLATLAGTVTASKIAVNATQITSPWVVSNGGTFAVQEATLDGCISAGKVSVTDSVAEASLATLAGAIVSSVSQDNNVQWGGAALTAAGSTATAGTDVAPVVRPIVRKYGVILTTTPLAANATFTSAWFDTNQTGDAWVSMSWASNIISANNVAIQQTDDSLNASIPIANVVTSNAATTGSIQGPITRRYWRVNYPNSATLQTTFELVVTASSNPPILQSLVTGTNIPYLNTSTATTDLMVCAGLPWTSSGNAGSNATLPVGQYVQVASGAATLGGPVFAAQRTPAVFKSAQVTASGNTPVWTPVSGKKFRLMKFKILLTDNVSYSAGPGVVTINLFDAGTITSSTITTFSITSNVVTINGTFSGFAAGQNVLVTGFTTGTYLNNISLTLISASGSVLTAQFTHSNVTSTSDSGVVTAGYIMGMDVYVPVAAISAPIGSAYDSGWMDLGNGYFSATGNNALVMQMTQTLASGNARIIACGTEE